MKIHDCVQGSEEWAMLRAGIPTSSQFHRIITPTGKKSEQREGYKCDLLAERMLGRPLEDKKTLPMQRGSMTETEAVNYYTFVRELKTEPCGFMTNDEETVGASPDRIVIAEPRGLLEVKCPEAGTHVAYLLSSKGAYTKYRTQCNGQLWISECDFVDVMSYYPALPEALVRIGRDEAFIPLIEEAVLEFSDDLERDWTRLVEDGLAAKPKKPIRRSAQEETISTLKEILIAMKS
jgi:hypothetical protein